MLLEKQGLLNTKLKINISIEKEADDLLMINIVNQKQLEIPSYWRLTDVVGIPPLEIGIDCQKGFISTITVFVDGFAVKKLGNINASIFEGAVLVNTDIFKRTNDYIDVNQSYDIYYGKSKLICSFAKINDFVQGFKMDRVVVFTNDENQIAGFSICDLSENEKNLIKSIIQRNE